MVFRNISKILIFFSLLPHLFSASVPYAGKVSIDGVNYDGEAIFAFEIMDKEGTVHWRNGENIQDGISIFVRNGRYSVELGGQGTKPLSENLFLLEPELYLKVRIDLKDGKGYRHLAPDQRISSTTHALSAEVARRLLPGAVSDEMLNERFRKYAEATFKPRLSEPYSDKLFIEGSELSITIPAEGEYLNYTWYRDGKLMPQLTGPSLISTYSNPNDHAGNYSVVISNEYGSIDCNFSLAIAWDSSSFSASKGYFKHFIAFIDRGDLYISGHSPIYFEGLDDSNMTQSPQLVRSGDVRKIAAGHQFLALVDKDGALWTGGFNSAGQLGTGDNNSTNQLVKIIDSGVIDVKASMSTTYFTKKDGSLWGMGSNFGGQLGTGDKNSTNLPSLIVSSGVVNFSPGVNTLFFTKEDGSLWGMGLNFSGILGLGDNENRMTPTMTKASGVSSLVSAINSSFFIDQNGALWGTGNNWKGQLGTGDTNASLFPKLIIQNSVSKVAISHSFSPTTVFSKEDGSLWGMGFNGLNGMLGTGDTNDSLVPKKIMDGGIAQLAAGNQNILIRKSDGSIWATGSNSSGQLGTGDTNSSLTPTKIWPREIAWTEQILSHSDGNQSFAIGDIAINSHSILVGAGGGWENDGSQRSDTAVYIFKPDSAGQFHQTDKIVSNDQAGFGNWIEANENSFVVSEYYDGRQEIFQFNENNISKIGSLEHNENVVTSLDQNKLFSSNGISFKNQDINAESLIQDNLDVGVVQYDINRPYEHLFGGNRKGNRVIFNFAERVFHSEYTDYNVTTELHILQENGSLLRTDEFSSNFIYSQLADEELIGESHSRPNLNQNLIARQIWEDPRQLNTSVQLLSITPDNKLEVFANLNGDQPDEFFGSSIDMSDDWLVIGAPRATIHEKENAGAIYVYNLNHDSSIERVSKIISSTPEVNAFLGSLVRIAGETVVSGRSAIEDYYNGATPENTKISVFNLKAN